MADRPNTIFSGTTGPQGDRPGPDRIITRLLIYALIVVFLPIAALVYGIWMALFTYGRMPWWLPTPTAIVLTLIGLLTGKVGIEGAQDFFEGIQNLFANI